MEVLDVLGPKQTGNFHELELRVCEPGHPQSFVISTGLAAFLETYKMPRTELGACMATGCSITGTR